jgi:hypothetical protein
MKCLPSALFAASVALALLLTCAGTLAATVKYPDGTTKKLAKGDSVAAAAQGATIITSDDGKDTLTLRKRAVVRYEGADADDKGTKFESFFLVKGGLDANIGYTSRLATTGFWASPEKAGARASIYAESVGPGTGYVRVVEGSGVLRLLGLVERGPLVGVWEVGLQPGQGLRLASTASPLVGLSWQTDQDNDADRGDARITWKLGGKLDLEVRLPRGVSGSIRAAPGEPGKLEVENEARSCRSGALGLATAIGGRQVATGSLPPGVHATVQTHSGSDSTISRPVSFLRESPSALPLRIRVHGPQGTEVALAKNANLGSAPSAVVVGPERFVEVALPPAKTPITARLAMRSQDFDFPESIEVLLLPGWLTVACPTALPKNRATLRVKGPPGAHVRIRWMEAGRWYSNEVGKSKEGVASFEDCPFGTWEGTLAIPGSKQEKRFRFTIDSKDERLIDPDLPR